MKNITYDPDADAAYICLKDSKIVDSETVAPGIICDYDENDQVVGIEILSVKNRTPEDMKSLDVSLKNEDKQDLRQLFDLFSYVA